MKYVIIKEGGDVYCFVKKIFYKILIVISVILFSLNSYNVTAKEVTEKGNILRLRSLKGSALFAVIDEMPFYNTHTHHITGHLLIFNDDTVIIPILLTKIQNKYEYAYYVQDLKITDQNTAYRLGIKYKAGQVIFDYQLPQDTSLAGILLMHGTTVNTILLNKKASFIAYPSRDIMRYQTNKQKTNIIKTTYFNDNITGNESTLRTNNFHIFNKKIMRNQKNNKKGGIGYETIRLLE